MEVGLTEEMEVACFNAEVLTMRRLRAREWYINRKSGVAGTNPIVLITTWSFSLSKQTRQIH